MDDDSLVPMSDEEQQPAGFDVVLRGYDRRQVDDYLDRVEAALNDADGRHAEDAQRLAALEQQVADMHERLADAERRASGLPEPAPVAGDRIAAMLRLADEEAASLRAAARHEADRIIAEAQDRAGQETATRSAELDRREQDLRLAQEQVDSATVQAQRDAEVIRAQAAEDAAAMHAKAQEDLRQLHEAGQLEAAAMTTEARRQVEELSRQRDAIAAQLQNLRDTLAGAVGAVSAPAVASPEQRTEAMRLPGDEVRTDPGA